MRLYSKGGGGGGVENFKFQQPGWCAKLEFWRSFFVYFLALLLFLRRVSSDLSLLRVFSGSSVLVMCVHGSVDWIYK